MNRILLTLYNIIFIPLSLIILFIVSLFNRKIKKGLIGRFGVLKRLEKFLQENPGNNSKIWFHVSSYGEYLQAEPVLMALKKKSPHSNIIVTVFSPSGHENIKLKPPIDFLSYIPFDTFFQMKKFTKLLSPQIAVIVRHDIWPNFVWRIRQQKVPLFLIDASLPKKSLIFLPVFKSLNRQLMKQFTSILTISEEEADRYRRIMDVSEKIVVTGDTKYDQVFHRSKNTDKITGLINNEKLKNKKILVAGSTWPTDEMTLIPAFQKVFFKNNEAILILAPHEPTNNRIEEIINLCQKYNLETVCYSNLTNTEKAFQCLIIDKIGLLANIYALGNAAFVGGSFKAKIHNVLEPAIYGVPIFFGPKFENSAEATNLIKNDAAILVESESEIESIMLKFFCNSDYAKKIGSKAKNIVMKNVGNSEKIADILHQSIN